MGGKCDAPCLLGWRLEGLCLLASAATAAGPEDRLGIWASVDAVDAVA